MNIEYVPPPCRQRAYFRYHRGILLPVFITMRSPPSPIFIATLMFFLLGGEGGQEGGRRER